MTDYHRLADRDRIRIHAESKHEKLKAEAIDILIDDCSAMQKPPSPSDFHKPDTLAWTPAACDKRSAFHENNSETLGRLRQASWALPISNSVTSSKFPATI
jgi:hypothetical protein